MERKVIQLAKNTLVVSLPNSFTQKYRIKKGQDVHLTEKEGGIFLSFRAVDEKKTSELQVQSLGKFDKNYISYLYQKGYDEIKVFFDEPEVYEQIKQRMGQLMGFEIVDVKKDSCTIKALTSTSREEFDTVFRRTFLLLLEMAESSVLLSGNQASAEGFIHLEQTNNKLTDYLKRVLNKHQYHEPEKTTFYYCLARDLEKIADCYRAMAEYMLHHTAGKDLKELKHLYEETGRTLRILYELFYKFDRLKAKQFLELRESLTNRYKKMLEEKTGDAYLVAHLGMVIHHVGELYGPFFIISVG